MTPLSPSDPLGFVAYLAVVFIPGWGIAELLDLWGADSILAERLALTFGLGLATDTVYFLVATSGIAALGFSLRGLTTGTLYGPIAFGLVTIALGSYRRRGSGMAVRPRSVDFALLVTVLVLALASWLHFQKYPIFPEYLSVDFGSHVQIVQSLISGTSTSIPSGLLYYGVHFQLAAALLLVGGEPLITLQQAMAVLVVLSPLLVYFAAKSIFSRRFAALIVAAAYSSTGTVWFVGVFDSGLFPNFFGILAVLFFLAAYVGISKAVRSWRTWTVFTLALVMFYFSHFTAVTILPALVAVPVVQYALMKRDVAKFVAPTLVSLAPAGIAFVAVPNLLSFLLSLATGTGGVISGSTYLTSSLAGIPVLSYLAVEVYDDVELVFLFLFAAVYAYRMARRRSVLGWVPLIWFAAVLFTSNFGQEAWRFSYEATVPLLLMAGFGLWSLLPRFKIRRMRTVEPGQYARVGLALAILLIPLAIGSWGTQSVSDPLVNTTISAEAQQNVYTAIFWLQANTPSTSRYLSVSDTRFYYTQLLIGRVTEYSLQSYPSNALNLAHLDNDTYILVTNVVTAALPADPSLYPWNNFNSSSSGMRMVYNNTDVEVYKVL